MTWHVRRCERKNIPQRVFRRRTTLECIFLLLGTVPFVRGAMVLTVRDREGSCLRASTNADADGIIVALRAFVSVRVRENRMTGKRKRSV